MIHYHGMPITPDTAAAAAVSGGHAFVSFSAPAQLGLAAQVCQSFALDNGAFSAWKRGEPVTDWSPYYRWVLDASRIPGFDFAVIPDVIDGTEDDNAALVRAWPLRQWHGVPVWHMHESTAYLEWLARNWPRVCIGSSGMYAKIGTPEWWARMAEAMRVVCDDSGRPITRLHGLRMLDPAVFSRFPFASADSTNIGRNIGIDQAWKGTYSPPTKEARAAVMRARIESQNSAVRWDFSVPIVQPPQQGALV